MPQGIQLLPFEVAMTELTSLAPTSLSKVNILTRIYRLHTADKLLRGKSRRIDALTMDVPGNREH